MMMMLDALVEAWYAVSSFINISPTNICLIPSHICVLIEKIENWTRCGCSC